MGKDSWLFWKQVKLFWAAVPQMEVKEDGKQQSPHWRNAVGSGFPPAATFSQGGTDCVKINLFQQACQASHSWSGEMVICPWEHCWGEQPQGGLLGRGSHASSAGRGSAGARLGRGEPGVWQVTLSGPSVRLWARSVVAETEAGAWSSPSLPSSNAKASF